MIIRQGGLNLIFPIDLSVLKLINTASDFIKLTSGVTSLFVLNYFRFSIALYADDVKVFRKMDPLQDCVRLQCDIDKLANYCKLNKIVLNIDKYRLERVQNIGDLGLIVII